MANDETVRMCDLCPELPAVAMYRWDWGEQGHCSQKGQVLLQQKAGNLQRHVAFLPLPAQGPAPLRRDERTRLISEKLAAESEAREVNERSTRLYEQNQTLAQQVAHLQDQVAQGKVTIASYEDDAAAHSQAREGQDKRIVELEGQLAAAHRKIEAGPGEAEAELESLRAQLEGAKARIDELEAAAAS